MELRRFLLLITAVLVIGLVLAIWFFPVNDDFRVENPLWNGSKDVFTGYDIQRLDSLANLSTLPTDATLIIIPYLNYSPAELVQLNNFTLLGGRVILADDFGHGNQVLEYLGLEARFAGQTLVDPLVKYKSKYFPKISVLQPNPLSINTDNIVFNHGTGLVNISSNDTIAQSSPFSFLDDNDNGVWDENETIGPLPVLSLHTAGKGQIVLIADPSIFINAMDKVSNNAVFIQNIMTATPAIYIDQSHLTTSDLQHTRNWLRQARSLISNPAGTIILVALVISIATIPVWHKKK